MSDETQDQRNFSGNALLKATNETINWTPEMREEYKKCMTDPIYFTEKYVKIINQDEGLINIKMYDYQKRLMEAIHTQDRTAILMPRQSAKCVTGDTKVTVGTPPVGIKRLIYNLLFRTKDV